MLISATNGLIITKGELIICLSFGTQIITCFKKGGGKSRVGRCWKVKRNDGLEQCSKSPNQNGTGTSGYGNTAGGVQSSVMNQLMLNVERRWRLCHSWFRDLCTSSQHYCIKPRRSPLVQVVPSSSINGCNFQLINRNQGTPALQTPSFQSAIRHTYLSWYKTHWWNRCAEKPIFY